VQDITCSPRRTSAISLWRETADTCRLKSAALALSLSLGRSLSLALSPFFFVFLHTHKHTEMHKKKKNKSRFFFLYTFYFCFLRFLFLFVVVGSCVREFLATRRDTSRCSLFKFKFETESQSAKIGKSKAHTRKHTKKKIIKLNASLNERRCIFPFFWFLAYTRLMYVHTYTYVCIYVFICGQCVMSANRVNLNCV